MNNTERLDVKKGIKYLPQILLVGLGIGTANYILFGDLNWLQWTFQSVSTSLIIGYSLVTIGANKAWFRDQFKQNWAFYLVPALLFLVVAFVATEAEQLIRGLVFQEQEYLMFSAGKLYLFNGIISLVLGLSFFQYKSLSGQKSPADKSNLDQEISGPISKIPVKKGEAISFIALEQIVYFEAFDNYSFVYTLDGEKKLCDYSLLFLEARLNEDFARIHRKYIVNKSHIQQIKPHLNGRHLLEFGNKIESITSSKSYSTTIQGLIKIK